MAFGIVAVTATPLVLGATGFAAAKAKKYKNNKRNGKEGDSNVASEIDE